MVSVVGSGAGSFVGRAIGRYRAVRWIATVALGEIYQAIEPSLGQPVAIELLAAELAANPRLADRFVDEAARTVTLRHPNLALLHEVARLEGGAAAGRPYLVLESLDGELLDDLLARRGRLDGGEAVALLLPIAAAIGEAHRRGLVHGALEPGSVFLAAQPDGRPIVKLLGLGISRLLERGTGASERIAPERRRVLAEYESPEQALGDVTRVGGASDVYSLGLLAYRLLAGTVPFPAQGRSLTDLARYHASVPPPSLAAARPELSPAIVAVVERALAKAPADRFATAESFAGALERASGSSLSTPVVSAAAAAKTLAIESSEAEPLFLAKSAPAADEPWDATAWGATRARSRRRALAVLALLLLLLVVAGSLLAIASHHRSATGAAPSVEITPAAPARATPSPAEPARLVAPAPAPEPGLSSSQPSLLSAPPASAGSKPSPVAGPRPERHHRVDTSQDGTGF